jgi:uncharacterized protein (TIGR02246 family)
MSQTQQNTPNPVQRYTDAWNSHDGSAVAECFSDDAVYAEVTLGERFEGRDAIRQFVDDVSVSLSTDYRFTLGQVIVTEDAYAWEWTMSGTNDRPDPRRGFAGHRKTLRVSRRGDRPDAQRKDRREQELLEPGHLPDTAGTHAGAGRATPALTFEARHDPLVKDGWT